MLLPELSRRGQGGLGGGGARYPVDGEGGAGVNKGKRKRCRVDGAFRDAGHAVGVS